MKPVADHFGPKIRKIFWKFFHQNGLLQVFLFPFSQFLNEFRRPKVYYKNYLWLEIHLHVNKFNIHQQMVKNIDFFQFY